MVIFNAEPLSLKIHFKPQRHVHLKDMKIL